MRIRYIGPGAGGVTRRIVGPYVWSRENNAVTDVDAEMAASLLTQPVEEFIVDKSEPLLALGGMTAQYAAEMTLAGVGSMADLAALDEDGRERFARVMSAGRRSVDDWARQARALRQALRPTSPSAALRQAQGETQGADQNDEPMAGIAGVEDEEDSNDDIR